MVQTNNPYFDYVESLSKQLDMEFQKRYSSMSDQLSKMGIAQSPRAMEYVGQLQQDYATQMAPVMAQAGIQQRQAQTQADQFGQQMQAQTDAQRQAASQWGMGFAETQKQRELDELYRQRELALREAQMQARQDAARWQQDNWWQQPAGDLAALGLYAAAGPVGGYLGKMASNWWQQSQQPKPNFSYLLDMPGYKPGQMPQLDYSLDMPSNPASPYKKLGY